MIIDHDFIIDALRRYEIEEAWKQREDEVKQDRMNDECDKLRLSLEDFIVAFREASYSNESELEKVQEAALNKDYLSVGQLIVTLIDKELMAEAGRIIE